MRQLIIQVPQGKGEAVLQIAKSCDAVNLSKIEAQSAGQSIDLVIVHISNRQVEDLLAKLEFTQAIQTRLLNQGFNIIPLVSVTVLEAPKTQ